MNRKFISRTNRIYNRLLWLAITDWGHVPVINLEVWGFLTDLFFCFFCRPVFVSPNLPKTELDGLIFFSLKFVLFSRVPRERTGTVPLPPLSEDGSLVDILERYQSHFFFYFLGGKYARIALVSPECAARGHMSTS